MEESATTQLLAINSVLETSKLGLFCFYPFANETENEAEIQQEMFRRKNRFQFFATHFVVSNPHHGSQNNCKRKTFSPPIVRVLESLGITPYFAFIST